MPCLSLHPADLLGGPRIEGSRGRSDEVKTVEDVHTNLKKYLEDKSVALMLTANSGSFAVAQFAAAKEACLAAGIPQEDIDMVVNEISERRRV